MTKNSTDEGSLYSVLFTMLSAKSPKEERCTVGIYSGDLQWGFKRVNISD